MCVCSPSLDRLRREFVAMGHANLGCCGDKAHQARRSDHNPDESGYAHAQDIGERVDHGLQWYVDRIMANPALFPQVKYLIYEGRIHYPNDGARPAGSYPYTGPNPHATHLHVSIHPWAHNYTGSWHTDPTCRPTTPESEEDDMGTYVIKSTSGRLFVIHGGVVRQEIAGPVFAAYVKAGFRVLEGVDDDYAESIQAA